MLKYNSWFCSSNWNKDRGKTELIVNGNNEVLDSVMFYVPVKKKNINKKVVEKMMKIIESWPQNSS